MTSDSTSCSMTSEVMNPVMTSSDFDMMYNVNESSCDTPHLWYASDRDESSPEFRPFSGLALKIDFTSQMI